MIAEEGPAPTPGRDGHVTHQLRHSEVPGAGSPLSRAVLAGPPRQALVLASFPTALYLSAGRHHEVLPVLATDALMLPAGTLLHVSGRDVVRSCHIAPSESARLEKPQSIL